MRVAIKEPMQELKVVDMEVNLSSLQHTVSGFIENIYIEGLSERKIVCYGNEEAKILELEPNFQLVMDGKVYDIVCGTVIFVGDDGEGGDKSLRRYNVEAIRNYLDKWSV